MSTSEAAIKDNRPFADILPHVKMLNLGGEHIGFTDEGSEELYENDNNTGVVQLRRRRKIALEQIEATLVSLWPSTSAKDKAAKLAALNTMLGTRSWTAIENKRCEELEHAAAVLEDLAVATQSDESIVLSSPEAVRDALIAFAKQERDTVHEQR